MDFRNPNDKTRQMTFKYPWHTMAIGDTFLIWDCDLTAARDMCAKISKLTRKGFKANKWGNGVIIYRFKY